MPKRPSWGWGESLLQSADEISFDKHLAEAGLGETYDFRPVHESAGRTERCCVQFTMERPALGAPPKRSASNQVVESKGNLGRVDIQNHLMPTGAVNIKSLLILDGM